MYFYKDEHMANRYTDANKTNEQSKKRKKYVSGYNPGEGLAPL